MATCPLKYIKLNNGLKHSIKEAKANIALLQSTEADFINFLLERLPPTPANYLSIIEKNLAGDFSGINPLDIEAGANRCAVS